jgi:hypothetical protein
MYVGWFHHTLVSFHIITSTQVSAVTSKIHPRSVPSVTGHVPKRSLFAREGGGGPLGFPAEFRYA